MAWSLEAELTAMTGKSDVAFSLRALGVCGASCAGCRIDLDQDWHRSGAETYALVARVIHADPDRPTDRVYLKACVAIGDLGGVSKIVDVWCRRRRALSAAGVGVPLLYGVHSGTVWEEYIPFELGETFSSRLAREREGLAAELGRTAGVLTAIGFPALDISDWRSRGEDVVLVDFGEDLGPPRMVSNQSVSILEDWLEILDRKQISLTKAELAAFGCSFTNAVEGLGTAN